MYHFDTPGPITVEVRNAAGDIRIDLTQTDATTVDVELTGAAGLGLVDEIVRAFGGRRADADPAGDRKARWWETPTGPEAANVLDRVRVEVVRHDDGDTLIVDTDPASRGWRTAFAVRVTAPVGSGVRVASQSADVTVTGTAGRLDVRTASGDVVAVDATGDARAATASGRIRLQSVDGDLSCRSASGDIDVSAIGGSAWLHSTSGKVRVQSASGDIEVRTVSGSIRIADLAAGTARMTSVSGNIDLGVHAGSLAAVDLSTISGSTSGDLEVSDAPPPVDGDDADQPARTPTLDIRARTTSGDIVLHRAVRV